MAKGVRLGERSRMHELLSGPPIQTSCVAAPATTRKRLRTMADQRETSPMRRRSSAKIVASNTGFSGGALKIGRFQVTSATVTLRTSAGGSGAGGGRKLDSGACIQVQRMTGKTEEGAESFWKIYSAASERMPIVRVQIYGERQLVAKLVRSRERRRAKEGRAPLHVGAPHDVHRLAGRWSRGHEAKEVSGEVHGKKGQRIGHRHRRGRN